MSEKQIQTIRGTVVKKCSTQTIRVATKITKVHPVYKKRYSQLKYYYVHDEADTAKEGDEVTIMACRPISKQKHWTLKK